MYIVFDDHLNTKSIEDCQPYEMNTGQDVTFVIPFFFCRHFFLDQHPCGIKIAVENTKYIEFHTSSYKVKKVLKFA